MGRTGSAVTGGSVVLVDGVDVVAVVVVVGRVVDVDVPWGGAPVRVAAGELAQPASTAATATTATDARTLPTIAPAQSE
jgi:hypothetical protein